MNKYENTLIEILSNKTDWTSIKEKLSLYNTAESESTSKTTIAGKLFEIFSKLYFLNEPEEKDIYRNAWLFDEIPLNIKQKLDLGNIDYGVDIVLEDFQGKYFVVQCKFKNDETLKLNWSKDKIANLFAFCPKADGYIVFSNASDIDSVSTSRYENFIFYGFSDLLEIDATTIENIYNQLSKKPERQRIVFEPKEHQIKAIGDCVDFFEIENRGQLVLPCGAGKTLTALWIKEKLKAERNLVLVPSLALLKQIKNEWAKQRSDKYQYLCVCSEKEIDNDNIDSIVTHTYEIGSNVTSDELTIKKFIYEQKPFVIFSTYQSLDKVSKAVVNLSGFEFDFVFCDEAHKTAGVGNNSFSLIHDNNKIPAKRRLYATATPRIVKESIKKKLGEDLQYAYDMNDPEIFGEEFYRMTFKEAIEKDILVDYKIVAIGVNDKELEQYINERRYVEKNISIDELANNYALQFVMSKYESNHALTFHSRIKYAKEFSERHKVLFGDTKCFYVSGEQTTSSRNIILNEFKISQKAIVSNARCLTEGVDVPTIDLVYFCDPKNSKVDVIQAVGRALRKKEGKKVGLVVVPIYHSNKDSVEDSIDKGSFKNLLQVIRSLCDQDERLQEEINCIAFGKGQRSSKKIDVINYSSDEEQGVIQLLGFENKLKTALFDQIVEKTSNNWDLWFLQFKDFIEKNSYYPTKDIDSDLYNWIAQQRNRRKNKSLSKEQIKKLDSIGFVWDMHNHKWDSMFEQLKEYRKNHDFEPLSDDFPDLAQWYRVQKLALNGNKLSKERTAKINSIVFLGSANRNKWLAQFDKLLEYRNSNADKWPAYDRKQQDSSESQLAIFCQTIRKRYRENDLEEFWFEKFVNISFNFDGKLDNWKDSFQKLNKYISSHNSFPEHNSSLYSWARLQIRKFLNNELSNEQNNLIESIQLVKLYNDSQRTWDDWYALVKEYKLSNDKLPSQSSEKQLGSWLGVQRAKFKKQELTDEQIRKLEDLDIIWDGDKENKNIWETNFNKVLKFKEIHNDWPSSLGELDEKRLYNWCQAQRQAQAGTHSGGKRKPLKDWQVDKLNSINFHWSLLEIQNGSWDKSFEKFKQEMKDPKFINIPTHIDGKTNELYTWWANQKLAYKKKSMSDERIQKFKEIGIDFSSDIINRGYGHKGQWFKTFDLLKQFITDNDRLPIPSSQDKSEVNLYQFLARTKHVYKAGELTNEQILLLKELSIEISFLND